jgi:hypothetical protein
MLELQLAEKRIEWKQKKARYRTLRSLSFFLLFMVITGALFAFFLISSRTGENRSPRRDTNKATTHAR